MKKLFFIFVTCLFSRMAIAQDTGSDLIMTPDRPGVGDAATIVPQGYYQLEAGLQYAKDETNFVNVREIRIPEVLLRLGLLSFAELRVRGEFTRVRAKTLPPAPEFRTLNSGLRDIMIGTKIQLLRNEGIKPDLALQADFRLPIGSKDFDEDKLEPKLRLNFQNKLSEKFALNYNLGFLFEEDDTPFTTEEFRHITLYTLALEYKPTSDFMVFIEAFGEFENKDMRQSIDAGIAYHLKSNLQLDAYVGYGLSEEAPDFFGSAGVSYRLPH